MQPSLWKARTLRGQRFAGIAHAHAQLLLRRGAREDVLLIREHPLPLRLAHRHEVGAGEDDAAALAFGQRRLVLGDLGEGRVAREVVDRVRGADATRQDADVAGDGGGRDGEVALRA